MIGFFHHFSCNKGGSSHTLKARNRAANLLRPVHNGCVELDNAVGIREAAVSHAGVVGIEFNNIHTGDDGIEDIRSCSNHFEGPGNAGEAFLISRSIPVARSDDDGLYTRD
jgi:hypothetical protein